MEMRQAEQQAWQQAQAAWPALALNAGEFVAFAAARAGEAALSSLCLPDLYLACACAKGDTAALEAFERRYIQRLGPALSRAGAQPEAVAEVQQRLRVQLLVPDGDRPPGIAGYQGRGDLQSWLRVIGLREAARVGKQQSRRSDESVDEPLTTSNPEISYVREQYRREVAAAIVAAVRGLDPAERSLLRAHLVGGLTIDDLGSRDGVHRATAARRLERARQRLASAVRSELMNRLRLDQTEMDGLFGLVRSRLELSVQRLLQ
jgi:RNA polymerase sigma-70 factor (ECF subfamily)